MQDIFAVVFLAAAKGTPPSIWAVAVIPALLLIRPVLMWLIERAGHGELLILLAAMMTVLGYEGFELVGLKGDLGALVTGALVAAHPKSSEMAKSLLSLKDLLLVGFFLGIGLQADPSWGAFFMALLLVALLPLKVAAYFFMLTRFRHRSRTALLASLELATYSEFGLIIAALGLSKEWISGEWLAVFALAVSISFVLAAPLNSRVLRIYERVQGRIKRYELPERLPEDRSVPLGEHRVVVYGMGGIGTTCYDQLQPHYGESVIGVDANRRVVVEHRSKGRRCVVGDAADLDFWDRCEVGTTEMILLCLPDVRLTTQVAQLLRAQGFHGRIGAIARYDDEVGVLRDAGCDLAFSMYREAGIGLVDSVLKDVADEQAVVVADHH